MQANDLTIPAEVLARGLALAALQVRLSGIVGLDGRRGTAHGVHWRLVARCVDAHGLDEGD